MDCGADNGSRHRRRRTRSHIHGVPRADKKGEIPGTRDGLASAEVVGARGRIGVDSKLGEGARSLHAVRNRANMTVRDGPSTPAVEETRDERLTRER